MTMSDSNSMLNSYDGPSPALEVAVDIAKRGALIAPAVI